MARKISPYYKTKSQIKAEYALTEKQFENLRRRTGERIKQAQTLYQWNERETPDVNVLIDYKLKRARNQIMRPVGSYELILETAATSTGRISKRSRQKAVDNIVKGRVSPGFSAFSSGIIQFDIALNNLQYAVKGEDSKLKEIPQFELGKRMKITKADKAIIIRDNDIGRSVVADLNDTINSYNAELPSMTAENAQQRYLEFIRLLMDNFEYASDNDALAGS